MGIDLTSWHPGLVLALVSVLCAFSTAILITSISVGLVQWRKVRTLRDMRDFVEQLIDQGYSVEEVERLANTFFEQKPGRGIATKSLKTIAR